MNAPELGIEDLHHKARYGESRQHQELFIPTLLQKGARDERISGAEQDQAYEIMKRWAQLEDTGKLLKQKETTLQGEFLTEVFGKALGYTLLSKGLEEWNLWPQFPINGGAADGAIGLFQHDAVAEPIAVIELKGPKANLDRDRSQGRTAVQQCWDYLNARPECQWGIVCNYVSFRLYHRERSNREYQLFVLKDLVREEAFKSFYYVLQREGLLQHTPGEIPRTLRLLRETGEQQNRVGDELYGFYDGSRVKLIQHLLQPPHLKTRENAIRIAQKLIDRIIFVAFCEDRALLPDNSIHRAYSQLRPFDQVTNPRWQNFLQLFRSIDTGNKAAGISAFDGGLFRADPEIDDLALDDSWTDIFETISKYDFRNEVNVEVLGNLFERSIKDLERIQMGGPLDAEYPSGQAPKMDKSAERKRQGVYYTPPEFTQFVVRSVVGKVVDERIDQVAARHEVSANEALVTEADPKRGKFWEECLQALRQVKIVDPACGSGAFLIAAYDLLEEKYEEIIDHIVHHSGKKNDKRNEQIPDFILNDNLFGVDLSQEAVEITQLSLWLRSAKRDKTLADLSKNVICGNSLVSNPDIHPRALNWEEAFSKVFRRKESGFDCVIGNPPWERMKLQEREYFDAIDPEIASAVNAATRRQLIQQLETKHPDVHQTYTEAKELTEKTLDYIRNCDRFPLSSKGDINTYAVFAELARTIVASNGMVGILVPSGIATDNTTKDFFGSLVESGRLFGIYDFENRQKIFPDVDGRFKFSVFLFGGTNRQTESADFVFFAHKMSDLRDSSRHIGLTPKDIALLNPNTKTCPIFRSRRDAEITKGVYRRVPILVNESRADRGNPWGIRFLTMFHQTNDAEMFQSAEQLEAAGLKQSGNHWKKGKKEFLPLYEAKMIQMYDHRAASVVIKAENWMRQGQTSATVAVQHQNPEYTVGPRWWVAEEAVNKVLPRNGRDFLLGIKDITSPTNARTVIASAIPYCGLTNHFPLLLTTSLLEGSCAFWVT